MRGHGIPPLLGSEPWNKLLWPQGCSDGEKLAQRSPYSMGWLVLILLAKVLEQADPPCCGAAPYASLPHVPPQAGKLIVPFSPF